MNQFFFPTSKTNSTKPNSFGSPATVNREAIFSMTREQYDHWKDKAKLLLEKCLPRERIFIEKRVFGAQRRIQRSLISKIFEFAKPNIAEAQIMYGIRFNVECNTYQDHILDQTSYIQYIQYNSFYGKSVRVDENYPDKHYPDKDSKAAKNCIWNANMCLRECAG